MALERFGLSEAFDVVVGVSTGAPTAAYFLSRQTAVGTSIYCEECTTARFFSFARFRMNADYLAEVFRSHPEKKLHQAAVLASRSEYFVGVTCAETGEGELLDAKATKPDSVQAIRASIAIPALTPEPVIVNGKRYLDGGGALPFPAHKVIEEFKPTDVLVLANYPRKAKQGGVERFVGPLFFRSLTPAAREIFRTRHRRFAEGLAYLRAQGHCSFAILWSDEEIGLFERSPKKLIAAKERADTHLSAILTKTQNPT
jgi:predicted patatin/cPLA2 family phospholipase